MFVKKIEIMKITFDFLENNKYSSVTDYCRDLIKQSEFPETLEVYRGEMLCLRVDVVNAAKIMPKNGRWVKYDKHSRKGCREA